MIESLRIKNFLSIDDEQTISFVAGKDKNYRDTHLVEVADEVFLNKLAIIYGYNASGKTNVLSAFEFLNNFWLNSVDSKEDRIDIVPFLLNTRSREEATEFKFVFYIDRQKYSYELKLKAKAVLYEKLDLYSSVQPTNVFIREYENGVSVIKFGKRIKINELVKSEINLKCLPNISVFSAVNQININIKEINSVIEWFSEKIMPNVNTRTQLREYSEGLLNDRESFKNFIIDYLQEADFNIGDVITKREKHEVPDSLLKRLKSNKNIPIEEISKIEENRVLEFQTTNFYHKVKENGKLKAYPLNISQQSEGTQRVFGLAGAIFETMKQNAFLTIDEIESKLHPRLIEYVLENFLRESEESQLLVTTHYDNLLDQSDLFRTDNFWFTEKNEKGATELYPLNQFTGLNRIASLQKAYKYGKFGAIPDID
jgi:AAA15 family ATPase/GTPase